MSASLFTLIQERLGSRQSQQVRQTLRRLRRLRWIGMPRRTAPLSDYWGFDRGQPVDRYYIEHFLSQHRHDIRGRVLEVLNSDYTHRFGVGVDRFEVLDIDPTNPAATVIADLANSSTVEADQFNCFVLTQTLQLIYDVHGAVRTAHRLLCPGGVLLVTVPALSKLIREGPDYWRFTVAACERLFGDVFGPEQVSVRSYGNVLTANAFLIGMAQEELDQAELDAYDPRFPVVVAVRAVKAAEPRASY